MVVFKLSDLLNPVPDPAPSPSPASDPPRNPTFSRAQLDQQSGAIPQALFPPAYTRHNSDPHPRSFASVAQNHPREPQAAIRPRSSSALQHIPISPIHLPPVVHSPPPPTFVQ